jgi:hypothetical protein
VRKTAVSAPKETPLTKLKRNILGLLINLSGLGRSARLRRHFRELVDFSKAVTGPSFVDASQSHEVQRFYL